MDKIDEILTRGVENIIPSKEELEKLLRSGKKLNIYYGIDPTNTKLHIGYAVHLRKLQQFVNDGHNVTLLIGDYTALVGDTSDKESERPILTYEEIKENLKSYRQQASKILDFSKIHLRYNGEWLSKLEFKDVLKLCQYFSLNDFISRELIRNRLTKGDRVRLDEVLYPIMQGYDSLHLDTDLQLGAADQTFNMQAGRILLKSTQNKESFILVNSYLIGTDGRKMSKTCSNAIWIEDPPEDMFGKVMSVRDDLIIQYFTLATSLPLEEIVQIEAELKSGKNPMETKKTLAHQIVKELHGSHAAEQAQQHFENIFQKQDMTVADVPAFKISDLSTNPIAAEALLVETNLAPSKTEAKRLIKDGAVELGGEVVEANEGIEVSPGDLIRVGKKRFLRFI